MIRNKISLYIASFLIIGFFFLSMPEKGYSGIPPLPGGPPCCDILALDSCRGGEGAADDCDELIVCIAQDENCQFFDNAICVDEGNGRGSCEPIIPTSGCCQVDLVQGNASSETRNGSFECADGLNAQECENEGGIFSLEGSCNEETGFCSGFVPPIEPTNVPALSEWGLITIAVILGVIGFIMVIRRKAAA